VAANEKALQMRGILDVFEKFLAKLELLAPKRMLNS